MTLHDLLDDPDVAFHDGYFLSFQIDWVTREASIRCDLCVGDPEAQDEAAREARRHGVLTLTGLLYFIIGPPDPDELFEDAPCVYSDDDTTDISPMPALPDLDGYDAFSHRFWINNWSCAIYVAATGARFDWDDT